MSEYKDLQDMIEVLHIAIIRQESEEQFFRRSANASTSQFSKTVFTEIADELAAYIKTLDDRKEKLTSAFDALKSKGMKSFSDGGIDVDPVCSMPVDNAKCTFISNYNGKQYTFCTEDCKKAFDIDPEKYLRSRS